MLAITPIWGHPRICGASPSPPPCPLGVYCPQRQGYAWWWVSKNSVVMRCSQPTVKGESALRACIVRLERETGFEPATACLEAIRT